jgi:hypothetical protein
VATALAARFRLYESPIEPLHPAAPNVAMTNGGAIGGEVEDYAWSFTPTAIELHSLAARSASLPPWLLPLGLSVLLAGWCLRPRR